MESKEEQSGKNLNMENAIGENKGEEPAPVQKGEKVRHLGKGEGLIHGGNVRGMWIRRLVSNFRWAIPNRHIDNHEVGGDVERFVEQMIEIRRKIKEQQMRHYMRSQTPEPDSHDDFCLIP